jgi:hypothetical protein
VVLAAVVCHCPLFHILSVLKCLPLQIGDGYNKAMQTSYLIASKYTVFLRFVLTFSSVLLLHRLKGNISCQQCTDFLKTWAPCQCSRCQKGDMKHVPCWRPTDINLVAGTTWCLGFVYLCHNCTQENGWHWTDI